jgi:hypothetical protein
MLSFVALRGGWEGGVRANGVLRSTGQCEVCVKKQVPEEKRTFQYPKSPECPKLAEIAKSQPVQLWNFISALSKSL